MRLPSSSSLVFATLAISSSSSTLSTLAAPTGDPAQAKSDVGAPNNNFMAARRGSVSLPRSQDDVQQETRSEEQIVEKRGGLLAPLAGILCNLPEGPLVLGMLGSLLPPPLVVACPQSSTAQSASYDAMSVSNGTDPSNPNDDPAWSAPPNTPATSSDVPFATETPASPPSRRDVSPASLPVQPTAVPDTIAGSVAPKIGAAEGAAPTQVTGAAPVDPKTVPGKVAGTVDGATGTAASEAVDPASAPGTVAGKAGDTASNPTTLPGTAVGVITGGAGTAGSTVTGNAPAPANGAAETGKDTADDKKQVPIKVVEGSPAPQPVQDAAGSAASTVPVRRSHRARRDVSASAPVQPSVPVAPSPPVQPPVSSVPTTTVTSTVTETAAPTSA